MSWYKSLAFKRLWARAIRIEQAWTCRRPICSSSTRPPLSGEYLPQDHRRLSRRGADWTYGYAMPRRRPRAWRHLRHPLECPQVAELIEQKYLVRTRVFAPVDPDLRGVETREAITWSRSSPNAWTATIWSATSSALAQVRRAPDDCLLCRQCRALAPHPGRIHQVGRPRRACRRRDSEARARCNPGPPGVAAKLDLITNCMVLTEGWDMPEVSCCILARPTRKMGLYRQMVGRVLRPAPGKINAIVLDHSGAVFRHGFVEDCVDWKLDPDKRSKSPTHARGCGRAIPRGCSNAANAAQSASPANACQHCGFLPQRPPQGDCLPPKAILLLSTAGAGPRQRISDPAERMRWHGMLTHIAMTRGYKSGWAAHMFRRKIRHMAARARRCPIEPSPEVLSWVRSRVIAYAKARAKQRQHETSQPGTTPDLCP